LHRGNERLVPELIAQWQECMALGDEMRMKHHGRWRPVEARRILDGLAATEKTDVAVRILRYVADFPSLRSGFEDFENFTFRLIERLGDMNLMGAFEKLSDNQPEPYRRWRRMRNIPVEQMRTALLRARLGEAALGLPSAE